MSCVIIIGGFAFSYQLMEFLWATEKQKIYGVFWKVCLSAATSFISHLRKLLLLLCDEEAFLGLPRSRRLQTNIGKKSSMLSAKYVALCRYMSMSSHTHILKCTVLTVDFLDSDALASKPPVADNFSVEIISLLRSRSAFRRSNISAFFARSSSLNLFLCTRCWNRQMEMRI